MSALAALGRWLATPLRAAVNLTPAQIRSLFAVAMLAGLAVLSLQNVWFTFRAEAAIGRGDRYLAFFRLVQEQMRYNSGLIAFLALIIGLVVFGADYLRIKHGSDEAEFGRGPRP